VSSSPSWSSGSRELHLVRALRATGEEKRAALPPAKAAWELRVQLGRFDHQELVELAELVRGPGVQGTSRLDDGRLRKQITDAVLDGRLLVVAHTPVFHFPPAQPKPELEEAVGSSKAAPAPVNDWFFVQLEDDEGQPLANQRYEVELADGAKKRGQSNAQGIVHLVGVVPGSCKFKLLAKDGSDWVTS
jgi:hypothetical protein